MKMEMSKFAELRSSAKPKFCTSSFEYGEIFKANLTSLDDVLLLHQKVKTSDCRSNTIWFVINDVALVKEIKKIFSKENLDIHFFIPNVEPLEEDCSYSTIATTYYQFHQMVNNGAKYIYISGELLFDIKTIRIIADLNNVKLISIPYKSFEPWYDNYKIYNSFILPSGIKLYQKYIDVIDTTYTPSNEELIYKYYKRQLPISGNVNLIIDGINIDERFLPTLFTEHRMNCKRICLRNRKCQKCFRDVEISKLLQEK